MGPFEPRAEFVDEVSKKGSFCSTADRGEAETDGNTSPVLGEFNPERECVAGDVGFEEWDGPAGRRAGPIGGLGSNL